MVYFGKVKNGKIELDPPAKLPEGAQVRVEPVDSATGKPANGVSSKPSDDAAYRIGEMAIDDFGPPDMAEQHDHYIYGTPKRPSQP